MEDLKASSVEELEDILSRYSDNALFRGQTSFYGLPDKPSVVSSFDRKVCIPSEMLKWCTYATYVLDVYVKGHSDSFTFQQALLQQYGWRSFFVDCSSDASVSAWFASHTFSNNQDEKVSETSEDYQERFVLLFKQYARYDFMEGEGHLFILDKTTCADVGLADLADISTAGSRPRTSAQAAWLVGPLHDEPLPDNCFLAHVSAKRSIFRDYAAKNGKVNTEDLFPTVKEDLILKALLGLPWRKFNETDPSFNLEMFRRSLDIPEYHKSYEKISLSTTAFYSGERLEHKFTEIEGAPNGARVISAPDTVIFGSAPNDSKWLFPIVESLVHDGRAVVFEIDELIKHPTMGHLTKYQKGIGVIPRGENLYELCELMVEHPGLDMTKVGLCKGRYYRRGPNGLWNREYNENECPCDSDFVHDQHISALIIAEDFLANPGDFL